MSALVLCAAPSAHAIGDAWIEVQVDSMNGPDLAHRYGIYDPIRDRMLVYGQQNGAPYGTQLWECRFQTPTVPLWRLVPMLGPLPTSRVGAAVAYDPVGDRMIMYGGRHSDEKGLNEVWSLSLSGAPTWQLLNPTGTPPHPRHEHAMIYDPVNHRMVVYGGETETTWVATTYFNDAWSLDLNGTPEWNLIAATGAVPPGRSSLVSIYDPVRQRMVIHGGGGAIYSPTTPLYALSLAGPPVWTSLPQPDPGPGFSSEHAAVYDSLHDALVVFGGGANPSSRTWSYSLTNQNWQQLASMTPHAFSAAALDTRRHRMLIQGSTDLWNQTKLRDFWALSLESSTWTQISPPQLQQWPGPRRFHAGAYDPVRDRLIVHGGHQMNGSLFALSLTGEPWWGPLPAAGIAPEIEMHQMVHDPVRDRMLLIGGSSDLNDIPVLNLSPTPTWTPLSATGMPSTILLRPSAIYDPLRDRILMFGGYSSNLAASTNDLWQLSLSNPPTWTLLSPAGPLPPARAHHTAIYDPLGDRMLVYGGFADPSGALGDLWQLSMSGAPTWSPLTPGGSPGPGARLGHTAVLDVERSRMLVYVPDTAQDTVWALSLTGPPSWTAMLPSGGSVIGRSWHVAAFDRNSDRLVVSGGLGNDYNALGDSWELAFADVVGIPDIASRATTVLHGAIPNPSRGVVHAWFTLPDTRVARLEVFDLHGRRVAERDIAGSTGRRSVPLEEMSRMPAGLYLMRLEHGGVAQTARFVHIQ